MISRFYYLCLFVTLGFFSTVQSQNKPNIILVIADDMGWAQTSAGALNMNNTSDFFETPVIQKLSREGITFPNGYVNGANCAPTRAAILSGQWASRSTNKVFSVDDLNRGNRNSKLIGANMGIVADNGKIQDELPGNSYTVAEALKSLGYKTAHFGKFHVGGGRVNHRSPNTPRAQGFDEIYGGGSPGNPGNYFAKNKRNGWRFDSKVGPGLTKYAKPYTQEQSQELAGNNSLRGTAKHVTDAMVEAAFDFMDNNANQPFFMHYSNFAIHGPYKPEQARPDLREKYRRKHQQNPSRIGHTEYGLAAITEGMDQALGRLVEYLKRTNDPRNPGRKLSENTLVYFVSDNGGAVSPSDNRPLRAMKGSYYEGGIRSLTFAWSEASFLANKGSINTNLVQAFDIYPTFVEMAGGNPSSFNIDGESLWSLLRGRESSLSRKSLFWHFPGYLRDGKRDQRPVSVIRRGDYKLIYNYEDKTYELYNLVNDISESNNLLRNMNSVRPSGEIRTLTANMSNKLLNYLKDVKAPLPTFRNSGRRVALPKVLYSESQTKNPIPLKDVAITLHPNPFANELTINFENDTKRRVQIIDVLGKLVFEKEYSSETVVIDHNDVQLSKGTYTVKIYNGDEVLINKVVKN